MKKFCLIVILLGLLLSTSICRNLSKRQIIFPESDSFEPTSDKKDSLKLTNLVNLDSILQSRVKNIQHGSDCYYERIKGNCSYFWESQCSEHPIVYLETINQINEFVKDSINKHCGYDGFDITLCCTNTKFQNPTTILTTSTESPVIYSPVNETLIIEKSFKLTKLAELNPSDMKVTSRPGLPCYNKGTVGGRCSYFSDPECNNHEIFNFQTKNQIREFAKNSMKKNCGYDGYDITICCVPNSNSVKIPEKIDGQKADNFEECGRNYDEFLSQNNSPGVLRNKRNTFDGINTRIVQGYHITKGTNPWIVAIGKPIGSRFVPNCGGSIITKRHVLTAAHCFKEGKLDRDTSYIRAGDANLNLTDFPETGVNYRICSLTSHSGFNFKYITAFNDIAILEICAEIEFNRYVSPICLPSSDLKISNKSSFKITGWGAESFQGDSVSQLKEAIIDYIPYQECRNRYAKSRYPVDLLENQHICAARGGTDSCTGDSGGPLLYLNNPNRFEIVGIVSFGLGCGQYPGVYTNVLNYLNWIQQNIK